MKLPGRLLSLGILFTLVASTPAVTTDYSMILGPPMKIVILQGAYVDAINIAYTDWLSLKARPPIVSQKVSVSPEPGTHQLYVRFMPSRVQTGIVGGGDVLYVIDLQKRKIVRRSFPM